MWGYVRGACQVMTADLVYPCDWCGGQIVWEGGDWRKQREGSHQVSLAPELFQNKGEWEPFLQAAHLYTVPFRNTIVEFSFFVSQIFQLHRTQHYNNDTAFVRFQYIIKIVRISQVFWFCQSNLFQHLYNILVPSIHNTCKDQMFYYNWVIPGDMFRPLNGHPQANLE